MDALPADVSGKERNKDHIREYNRKYRAAHPEQYKAYYRKKAERVRANPVAHQKRLEYGRKYYREHKEEACEARKRHRLAHIEEKRAYDKAYYAKNKEQFRQYHQKHHKLVLIQRKTKRREVLILLSGKDPPCCVKCGCTDYSILNINHLHRYWMVGDRPNNEQGDPLYNRILNKAETRKD